MHVVHMSFALLLGLCSDAQAEWVVSLYTGTSRTRDSDLRVVRASSDSDVTFANLNWEARPFEDAPYYGLRVAYFPSASGRLGGTFDFTHYKMYTQTDRVTLEISHGVNLTSLNAEFRWPGRWSPHIGAGIVGYWPHAEGTIDGTSVGADYHFAGGGAQAFAGTEYRLSRRVGVFIEGKADAGRLDIDLTQQARLVTHTRTLHALAGVAWHFSPSNER